MIERLSAVVGAAHVLTDADVARSFTVDWTGRWQGWTPAVVRPGTTAEVAGVLRVCAEAGVAVVPQGGNTGLVGGGVPRGGEVVLSLTRLDSLGPPDPVAAQVSAGAGVTLARVQAAAAAEGLAFAVDLSARDSATVGGMVATNAGGLHVIKHGAMRAQVVGIEVVLADGTVVRRMDGLIKDNSGYDLAGLCCGSEGTLAVVTEVRLRLVPRAVHRVCAVIGLPDLAGALDLLGRLRPLASLEAVEVMFADGIEVVRTATGATLPLPGAASCALLVECAGAADPTEELAAVISQSGVAVETVVASDGPGRARLWTVRERHTEAVNALGIPHKLDVTLPLSRIGEFESTVRRVVNREGTQGDRHLTGPPP